MSRKRNINTFLTSALLGFMVTQPAFASLVVNGFRLDCDYSRVVHLINIDFREKAPVLITSMNTLDQGFAGAEASAGNNSFELDAHCGYCGYSCTYFHNGSQSNAGSVHLRIQSANNAPQDLIFNIENKIFAGFKTHVFALPNAGAHLQLVSNQPTGGGHDPILLAFKTV